MATLDEKKAPSTEGSIPSLEKEKDNDSVQKHYVEGVDEIGHEIRALGPDVEEAMLAAESMSQEEVDDAIRYIVEEHGNDPNFPTRALELAKQYLYDDDVKNDTIAYRRLYDEAKVEAALVTYNSVYAEVRAVVSNKDDPTLPCLTIRTWIIGLIYVAVGAFLNQFFSIRQPGITITSNVAQMLAYPVGKAMERLLPTWEINLFGLKYSLNPGPFNMKEHMLITIMANVGFSTPYTAYIIWVQFAPRFFNLPWAKNFGYQVLISLSTNFIGYGLAGITRRFLVYPSHAIWPTNLAIIALNKAFHANTNPVASGWKVSRMHFFLIAFTGMFIYFWFPNYIFQALSYFNWMTWISPNNVMLAAVTGGVTGLGFNPIPTFDWNILTFEADPIVYPFFTVVNFFLGALFTLPIILAVWVHNVWFTAYLPINSNGVFDNTGNRYNISLAVDSNGLFDVEAYKQYSPAYLACANILLYGFFFAAYAATISHAYLYHRREIANGFRHLWRGKTLKDIGKYDIHVRLMSAYPEVSEWWYFGVLVFSIVVGAIGVAVFPTSTSPAVVLYGVLLAAIFCVPIGIIQAITNAQVTLNVLAEFFGGLWFPGNANALNFFKSYGYVTTAHTLSFAQDLKLAHYTHIPPFATFWAQMVATLASTFVSIGILNFQMTQIEDVCSPTQKDRFTCPGQNTFFTASVLWGTLGPARMFGSGAIYNGLIWCFLIGFLLPFLFYYLRRWFPITRYFHLPVFFLGALIWAPFNISFIWPAVPIAWFFSVYIKRRHLDWWSKYAYILSAAFACGIAISGIIQFFAVQFHEVDIVWGGNTIPYDGCDGNACTLLTVPDGGHFGPGVGEFS